MYGLNYWFLSDHWRQHRACPVKNTSYRQMCHISRCLIPVWHPDHTHSPGPESAKTCPGDTAEVAYNWVCDGIPYTSTEHYDQDVGGVQLYECVGGRVGGYFWDMYWKQYNHNYVCTHNAVYSFQCVCGNENKYASIYSQWQPPVGRCWDRSPLQCCTLSKEVTQWHKLSSSITGPHQKGLPVSAGGMSERCA